MIEMKGKIPITTKCGQCNHVYTFGPGKRCGFTHKTVPTWYADGIPVWCPLPDADRLLALLEMKGETNVADSLEVPASDN